MSKTLWQVFEEEEQAMAPPEKKKPTHTYYGGGRPPSHGRDLNYRLTLAETEELVALAAAEGLSLYKISALLVREGLQRRKDKQE